jgi:hypothetical protein
MLWEQARAASVALFHCISSKEAKHFIECIRTMAENLLDNVEYGFRE